MQLAVRPYNCPVCTVQIAIGRTDDILVLLESVDGQVDHVVTFDDVEVHRCRMSGALERRV